MHRALIALLSLLMLHGTGAAQGQRRLAFVVGIEDYRDLRGIVRPVSDARAVHDRLSQLGFTSELVVNLDGRALEEAFSRFTGSLQEGDVALVYFSGHAGRVGDEFTLLAADAPPQGGRPEERGQLGAQNHSGRGRDQNCRSRRTDPLCGRLPGRPLRQRATRVWPLLLRRAQTISSRTELLRSFLPAPARGPSIALAMMITTHTRFSPERCSAIFRKAGRWLVLLVPFERR